MWTFGNNATGQLGDGTWTNRYRAVQATYASDGTALTAITDLEAGHNHSVSRRADGTMWSFGRNQYGQLGDNTTTTRYAAVQSRQVDGTALTNTTSVAAGIYQSLLARADGTVWAMAKWGTGSPTATDFAASNWAGLTTSAGTLHTFGSYDTATHSITVAHRANPAATQKAGSYSGAVTFTATANP